MMSTSSSKSTDVDEAAALSAAWSRMYPDGVLRPRFNPTDLKKLCPDFSSNPVLYKCYCSYKVYKKSLNQRALTLEAFELYYSESDDTIPVYESLCDPVQDFE